MERYAIADWLTDEQKARAVNAPYAPRKRDGWLRAPGGFCPLGIALRTRHRQPDCWDVVRAVAGIGWELRGEIIKFMDDWDAGKIPPADLAAALGYDPSAGRG